MIVHSTERLVGGRSAGEPLRADEDDVERKIMRQVDEARAEGLTVTPEVRQRLHRPYRRRDLQARMQDPGVDAPTLTSPASQRRNRPHVDHFTDRHHAPTAIAISEPSAKLLLSRAAFTAQAKAALPDAEPSRGDQRHQREAK